MSKITDATMKMKINVFNQIPTFHLGLV